MLERTRGFLKDEDGAVTIDWVVLTAAVVGLQIFLVVSYIREPMVEVSAGIGDQVAQAGQFLN